MSNKQTYDQVMDELKHRLTKQEQQKQTGWWEWFTAGPYKALHWLHPWS